MGAIPGRHYDQNYTSLSTEGRHLADLWRQYRADNPDSWSIKLLELIHKKHGSLPFKPEEADFTRYPHFATYPAGYYTYL